jgi:hypothetical protein
MLEFLAFDEYCRFDTSALLSSLQRASIYTLKEKAEVSKRQYLSKAKSSNVRERG